jgi:3-oxoacyl-[acyl-carrier protein] reductase
MTGTGVSAPRVALVTGGSRGIGRSIAERLGGDGLSVVVGYASNRTEAEAAVAAVRSHGSEAIAMAADVGDERAVADLFDRAEQTFGGVDVVVHAAGVMLLAPLAELDVADLDRMHRVNIRGTFLVNRQAARRVRPGGAIVNLSSSVVGRVLPAYSAYAASKAAVGAMTFVLAHELRGRDVTANAVAPGPTATEMLLDGVDEQTLGQLAAAAPLQRLGTPADIASVVAFLTGPEGRWVNGQTIRANGGVV